MSPNPQQFIQVLTGVLDEWMPKLKPECLSLLCAVVRKTLACDKTEDTISVSQLEKMTGMKDRRIQRNMKRLVESGAPVRVVSNGKQGARYAYGSIEPVTADGVTPAAAIQPVTGDALESSPSPVTPTTDVLPTTKRVRKDSLLVESSRQGAEALVSTTNTTKPTVEVNGSVVETNSTHGDLATGCLVGTPTAGGKANHMETNKNKTMASPIPSQDVLFTNHKTGRTWAIGQDVDCLSCELGVTKGEAEAIMADGNGMGAASILATLKANWGRIKTKDNRVGHIRMIIWNQAPTGGQQTGGANQANPSPCCAGPPPL